MRSQASIVRARDSVVLPSGPGPHVLLYDIETMAGEGYMWDIWNTNIIRIKHHWYLLSNAYKWYRDPVNDSIQFDALWDDPKFKPGQRDDYYMAARIHALFDAADVTVAHNGDSFDRKKVNARLLQHDLPPPAPYKTIDTKKESARYTNQLSNSLANLAEQWGFGGKTEHPGFDMWLGAAQGEKRWTDLMEEYNRNDIELLEKVYEKMLPWIGSPGQATSLNRGMWADGMVCPKCGHDKLIKRGFHRTLVSEFQTWQCKQCGGYTRSRFRETQADGTGVQLV